MGMWDRRGRFEGTEQESSDMEERGSLPLLVGEETGCIHSACTSSLQGCRIMRIRGGLECRRYLKGHTVKVVVVADDVRDVSALNLIAALSKDMDQGVIARCPLILLTAGEVSGSLSSRARSAGVFAIVSPERLGIALAPQISQTDTSRALSDSQVPALDKADQTLAFERVPQSARRTSSKAGLAQGSGLCLEREVYELSPEKGRATAQRPSDEVIPTRSVGHGKIISYVSGSGGSGRTTMALLSALLLDRRGLSIALVDFDAQFGDLGYLLGRKDVPAIDELIASTGERDILQNRIRSMGVAVSGKVQLFASPKRPEMGDRLIPHVGEILAAFQELFDVTIVDTGGFWNEMNAAILQASDRVIEVCDQRSSSIAMASRTLDLCARLGVPLVRMSVLLNRCDSKAPIDEMSAQIALKGPRVTSIADGGREVDELIGLGCPEDLLMLKNPCIKDIDRFVMEIMHAIGLEVPSVEEASDNHFSFRQSLRLFRKGAKHESA